MHAREVENTADSLWRKTCGVLCDKPSEFAVCILIGGLVGCIPDSESTKLPPADISPMHLAVLFDLPIVVTMLCISEGFECLNATDTNGNTPLSWAAYSDRATAVETFLSITPGPDLNHVGLKGRSAVFYAAGNGSVKVLEILSRQCPPIIADRHDSQGLTPTIAAANNGHVRCVNILIENFTAQIDLADTIGATPLLHATRAEHIDVIRVLLGTHGANATCATTNCETALSEAILGGHKEAMTILGEHLILHNYGKHLEGVVHKTMFKIASNGNIRAFRNILELCGHLGAITNKKHWTALHYATFNGNIQVLRLLLAKHNYGLYFNGPPDSSEVSDYSDGESSWVREQSNRIISDLSTLVASPAFIRPGKSPAISQIPTGIIPCAQLLLEKLHPSSRLNLMLKTNSPSCSTTNNHSSPPP